MMKILVILCLLPFFKYCVSQSCSDTSCTPAPGGVSCERKSRPGDPCCPEWYCSDGAGGYYTVYGKSSGSSFSSSSGSFSQSSSGGDMPMPNLFGGGGFGGLPGFGQMPFGLFGRR